VHPPLEPAPAGPDRTHARRHVSDRERQNQPPGDELPVQSVAGRSPEERRADGTADESLRQRVQQCRPADRRARAEGQGVQSLERERRNLSRTNYWAEVPDEVVMNLQPSLSRWS